MVLSSSVRGLIPPHFLFPFSFYVLLQSACLQNDVSLSFVILDQPPVHCPWAVTPPPFSPSPPSSSSSSSSCRRRSPKAPEMTLSLCSPCLSRLPPSSALRLPLCPPCNPALLSVLLGGSRHAASHHLRTRRSCDSRASLSESEHGVAGEPSSSSASLSDEVVGEASGAGDADEALRIIAEKAGGSGGVVGASDCCSIVSAALERGNAELALSVFYAMRATFDQGVSCYSMYISCPRL